MSCFKYLGCDTSSLEELDVDKKTERQVEWNHDACSEEQSKEGDLLEVL